MMTLNFHDAMDGWIQSMTTADESDVKVVGDDPEAPCLPVDQSTQ